MPAPILNARATHKTQLFYRRFLPVLVLLVAVASAVFLVKNPPQSKKKPQAQAELIVEALTLKKQEHQVRIKSFGLVSPQIQGSLVAEVSGRITQVGSEKGSDFKVGNFFKKGDLLLSIDNRDYKLALDIAKASLSEAKLRLSEEQARVAQAKKDWQRLGKGAAPSSLVLRKPQLASAQAAINSAKANMKKAELALSRTRIYAPYDGRLLERQVDIGQFVTVGTKLANIFATEHMQVRLPVNSQQQNLLEIPEPQPAAMPDTAKPSKVLFSSTTGKQKWQGHLLRAEAALDQQTRQLYLVAQINQPYENPKQSPIKLGQFVQAEIEGKRLKNIFRVPRANLYSNNQVLLLENNQIKRQAVSVLWAESEYYIVDSGLKEGDVLITTPLNNAITGTKAKLAKPNAQTAASKQANTAAGGQ